MVSALSTGFVLCMIGVIAVLVAPALISLIVNQLCDLQRTGIWSRYSGKHSKRREMYEVITAGFLTIFA